MIIQKSHPFVPQVCDPVCMNGGVCSNGLCKCGKQYEGEQCEIRLNSSSTVGTLLWIFIFALMIAGIVILYQNAQLKNEMKKRFQDIYAGDSLGEPVDNMGGQQHYNDQAEDDNMAMMPYR